MEFADLDQKYWTDKGFRKHGYFSTYERLLRPLVGTGAVLLELGVRHGLSMLVWRDYLENGVIHGVDLVRTPQLLRSPDPRLVYHRCDCTDGAALGRELGEQTFDVIIDDASHETAQQWRSWELLWERVRPGGWYVIEDVGMESRTHFEREWGPEVEVVDLRGGRRHRRHGDSQLLIRRRRGAD